MSHSNFTIANLPHIEFGSGKAKLIPNIIKQYGKHFLLVTGSGSIEKTSYWAYFIEELDSLELSYDRVKIETEPSPELVDQIVAKYKNGAHQCVLGLGGGSVLDAAKAISGLISTGDSVMNYLEGVGPELIYTGPALAFIAAPTTAGTGSEATKNSVLSKQTYDGFKKSFRDKQLVAEYAIVDPDLLESCPRSLIAANGMDAITQLMESYVSSNSNPITDALALDGLNGAKEGLLNWYSGQGDQNKARSQMAYASLLSGICLAQTGLGSVHGLASPLGAFFPIPHGVVCGTLLAAATELNIHAMLEREPNNPALKKYVTLGRVLCKIDKPNDKQILDKLIKVLYKWTDQLGLPKLSHYKITPGDYPHIIANSRGSSMKTNPIKLTDNEIQILLEMRQ